MERRPYPSRLEWLLLLISSQLSLSVTIVGLMKNVWERLVIKSVMHAEERRLIHQQTQRRRISGHTLRLLVNDSKKKYERTFALARSHIVTPSQRWTGQCEWIKSCANLGNDMQRSFFEKATHLRRRRICSEPHISLLPYLSTRSLSSFFCSCHCRS